MKKIYNDYYKGSSTFVKNIKYKYLQEKKNKINDHVQTSNQCKLVANDTIINQVVKIKYLDVEVTSLRILSEEVNFPIRISYFSLFRSIMNYAIILWGNASIDG